MASLDRPKLRPLTAQRIEHDGQSFALVEDPLHVVCDPILIPFDRFRLLVRHFDGLSSLTEIQHRILCETGQSLSEAELESLVQRLDRIMVLDGPTFASFHDAYRRETIRPPALAGRSYESSERALREQLGRLFNHSAGSGSPRSAKGQNGCGKLRGVLSPHIDFQRGGPVYTWSYRELIEQSDADIYVILGVAHQYCRNRFALTRKSFQTPLGVAKTDGNYVDQIASLAGAHLFDDELAHRTEHSIEFQVVFLQYVLGRSRDFTIVPILVGSFHDLMDHGKDPIEAPDVRQFVDALRTAETASGKRVAYIGGIDLCHVGPEFGDAEPVDRGTLEAVRQFDRAMLDRAVGVDPTGWFRTAAQIANRWRVCGLAATYTMLHALGPAQGRLLRYDQAVDDRRTCCVTFASVAFDSPDRPEVAQSA